jgi:hypothetical protein
VPVASASSVRTGTAVAEKAPERVAQLQAAQLQAAQLRSEKLRASGQVPVAQQVAAGRPGLAISTGIDAPVFDQVARVARQMNDMVPV